MEKLKLTNKYKTYNTEEGFLPESLSGLEDYLRKFVIWIENIYSDITNRVNWLLTNEVETHTSDDTLTEHETGSIHSNLGASGAITLTLPTVTVSGIKFTFAVQVAQELRVDPGAAAIRDDSGQTDDKYKTANAIGECLQIVSDADGDWYTIAKSGTWTEEA
jgi:hypothetical protein